MHDAIPHWLWWSRQPEIITADQQREEEQRRKAWQVRKLENKVERHQEKLQRAGLSDRDINRLRRLAGITREDIAREASSMVH